MRKMQHWHLPWRGTQHSGDAPLHNARREAEDNMAWDMGGTVEACKGRLEQQQPRANEMAETTIWSS